MVKKKGMDTPDPRREARDLALIRLSVREYGAREMLSYLKRKGIEAEVAAEVVHELTEEKLLDDRRYARAMTRSQANRDKGPGYILGKLKQKGVRIELSEVREIFSETSDRSEMEMAQRIVERRYPRALPPTQDEKEVRRAYSALIRRGFSSETARKCLFK
jgi:regulatory protein